MSTRFEGKVAVVTGAASGIGLAIAQQLLTEGASVVGGDLNGELLRAAELGDRTGRVEADGQIDRPRPRITPSSSTSPGSGRSPPAAAARSAGN